VTARTDAAAVCDRPVGDLLRARGGDVSGDGRAAKSCREIRHGPGRDRKRLNPLSNLAGVLLRPLRYVPDHFIKQTCELACFFQLSTIRAHERQLL
jgi:hypothetical protein